MAVYYPQDERGKGSLRHTAALYFPFSPALTFEKRTFNKENPSTLYTSY